MLTAEQEKWINHLSDRDEIHIFPFDPTAEEKFQIVRQEIQAALGDVSVEHHGASSLGISGQDEIDIYVPVEPDEFDAYVEKLDTLYGKPKSFYPLERARFGRRIEGKRADVFLVNKRHTSWTTSVIFESYLCSHPDELDAYRCLKEECNGLSCREYYRRKIIFINLILAKAASELA